MCYTSHHDLLCCFCKQQERTKLLETLESMVIVAHEEKLNSEKQLARCLQEKDILFQQLKEQISYYEVSPQWFQSYSKQNL